ncbi:MAG: class I SAM-dependent methyltransferase [Alphaproteobacteria bacterium]
MQSAFEFARHIGPIFGSEKIAFLLYSLVRIRRPEHVIELGCGTGATAFCMAQALCENGHGRLLTVDNEQAWPAIAAKLPFDRLGMPATTTMAAFVAEHARRFGVAERLTYHKSELPPFPTPRGTLDFLFVDYNHRPENVIRILATYLPVMAPGGAILFDSAATYFPTFQLLENLESAFAAGRVPAMLLRDQDAGRTAAIERLVRGARFRFQHFVEKDKAEQNSTSAIFIEPFDVIPAADAAMRMG